jgi:hypothetical protein
MSLRQVTSLPSAGHKNLSRLLEQQGVAANARQVLVRSAYVFFGQFSGVDGGTAGE